MFVLGQALEQKQQMMKDLQEAHMKEMKEIQAQNDEVISGFKKQIEVLELDVATARNSQFHLKTFKEKALNVNH